MMWDLLLCAALEANLGVLAEAGFSDEVRILQTDWTTQDEKARRDGIERAVEQAQETIHSVNIRALLNHQPFQEVIVTRLLDPTSRFSWQAAVAGRENELPQSYIPSLQRFFNAFERALFCDKIWGPILNRYLDLRFRQDVMEVLVEQELDIPQNHVVSRVVAELRGSGAIAQGDGAVVAGASGMAIRGNVARAVQVVIQELTVQENPSALPAKPEDTWICPKCNNPNAIGLRFCNECGAQIGMECPECKELVEMSAKFCSACGVNQEKARYENNLRQQAEMRAKIQTLKHRLDEARNVVRLLEEVARTGKGCKGFSKSRFDDSVLQHVPEVEEMGCFGFIVTVVCGSLSTYFFMRLIFPDGDIPYVLSIWMLFPIILLVNDQIKRERRKKTAKERLPDSRAMVASLEQKITEVQNMLSFESS